MRIRIMTSNWMALKASKDIMTVCKQLTGTNEFVCNPELGVLDLRGNKVTEKRDKEYWNAVAEALKPYYDVTITKETVYGDISKVETLTVYDLGTNTPVLITKEEAEKIKKGKKEKKNENKVSAESKPAIKNRIAKLFSRKPKTVQE